MTIQIFNSILTLSTVLKLSTDINKLIPKKKLFNIYSNNYIVEHNKQIRDSIEYHNIKCWKSNCIFNYHIENEKDDNMIFSLDFSIYDTFIKIDYLDINNDFYNKKYFDYSKLKILLTNDEVKLLRVSLINFIENWAIKKNINKIITEIHINLERYNAEFKELGFVIITENKRILNPYWIEIEKEFNNT